MASRCAFCLDLQCSTPGTDLARDGAVPFSNASARSQITSRFRIKALPSLVLLDATGRLLSTDLISKINVDPDAEHFPWTPKLVAEAQDCEQRISECAATVVLCEGMGSSEQERVRKLLEEAATAEQERAREEGEEDGVFFCVCAESGEFRFAPIHADSCLMPGDTAHIYGGPVRTCDVSVGWARLSR